MSLSLNRISWDSTGGSFIVGDKSCMFIANPILNDQQAEADEDPYSQDIHEDNK